MSLCFKRLAASLALAAAGGAAHAAGYALIEQNASGLGNAYAGQAAAASDASTIYFNPAGMTRLPDRQIVVAGHLIKPRAEFSGTSSAGVTGGQGGDAGDWAFVPNAYVAMRLTPDLHLGLGLNSPFGLKTEYEPEWIGRYQAIESELKTINLNPSVAYKLSETFSVGAGLNIQWIEATLTHRQPLGPPPFPAPLLKIKGDDYGWGYNLGALWQATPATRIGVSYRSEVDYTLEGTSSTSDPVVNPLNGPVTAEVTLPDSASLSLFHTLSPQWDLLADVSWTGWSDFDDLPIRGTVDSTTIENWSDSLRYSLGATWHANEKWSLRGGIAYDEAPVSDRYRTPRIPDGARTWVALGGQYRVSKRSALDFGYAHLFVNDPGLQPSTTTLDGEYDSAVDIVSAQFTLNF
ncbi:long chain fatty acid transport protein [Thiobacillus denitrificans ATCC 25259]|uniref:Long chain fatty acid transport protein n=1 Tax=Thiobacillus denitrificans (strain ATCC 25259 / T1) TaxID=292415 RepID=Q3SFQ7_THIDA|nr:outer membrane protein transport protein [Thiobacillus denitrificans]AAZ98549.1 long chain fatty acid transport protein [Thiobacillus denitrificans ATCC 25259]